MHKLKFAIKLKFFDDLIYLINSSTFGRAALALVRDETSVNSLIVASNSFAENFFKYIVSRLFVLMMIPFMANYLSANATTTLRPGK